MIHHINALAWIDPMSRTTSRPRSVAQAAAGADPPFRPSPSSGRPLAGRARSRPRRLRQARAPNRLGVRPGLHVGRYLRPGEAVRVAVRVHRRELVPDVAGVVSPRRGRHCAGHSLRPHLDFRLFALRQVFMAAHCRVPTRCYREKEGGLPDGGFSAPYAFRAEPMQWKPAHRGGRRHHGPPQAIAGKPC